MMELPCDALEYVARRARMLCGRNSQQYEDAYQDGVIGLIEAQNKFDPTREVKFTTFASLYVDGRIKDGFRQRDNLSRTHRRKIKSEELPNVHLIPIEYVELDCLPIQQHDADEEIDQAAKLDLILSNLHLLTKQECVALQEYYFNGLTMWETGERIGVGESRVSQLLSRAVCKLRRQMSQVRINN